MEIFHGEPFVDLRRRGARIQRPLWASTGTKDSAYSDVKYLEGLAAPETITTVPPATLDAFRDHGSVPARRLESFANDDEETLAGVSALGLDLGAITGRLQSDGVAAFARSYQQLLEAVADKRTTLRAAS
jgi:transaldolase